MNRKKNKSNLKKLYNLHAWLGFQLAIIMFVILATGTIATISNEIDWLIFDELRASEKPANSPQKMPAENWQAIYATLKESYPNGQPVYLKTMGEDYLTYRATIIDDSLHHKFVQIDQWTHKITGTMPQLTVQRFFRDFHRYLFMPALPGIIIVCFFAFILVISLYTGLKTTRNWKKALWRFRVDQGPRITLSDAHKLSGLWGIWFTCIICITGIWYLYEFSFRLVGATLEPRGAAIERVIDNSKLHLSSKDFNEIVQLAQLTHKDWEITSIFIPQTSDKPIQMRGIKDNPLLRERAYRVYIDPITKEVIDIFTPDSIGTNAYLNEYIDPLHFGFFAGLWSKLIWFFFGLALTGLSVTGVIMSWKRTKSKALTQTQIVTLPLLILTVIAFLFWLQRYI